MMSSNSYDRDALEKKLRGMSKNELRRFWKDLVNNHNAPYPKYLRVALRAANQEILRRAREKYCPVTKIRQAMAKKPAHCLV